MGKVIRYVHHDIKVAVDETLKGTHREQCLCYRCRRFKPSKGISRWWRNCFRANLLYKFCVLFSMTTPVFECPADKFEPKIELQQIS